MKFSLLLICFSSLVAEQSLYTVSKDKPFMYFDGKEWRERKSLPDRYSNITSANESSIELINFDAFDGKEMRKRKSLPDLYTNITSANESSIELINFDAFETIGMPTSLNNSLFKDYEIHKRASDNKSVNVKKYSRSDNNAMESETNIILNQILNFIETRYNNTKDTNASASLSSNPKAWIKLVLELSKALKEIAVRANESYYMLIQQPTPSFVIKTWRKSYRNRREDEGQHGLVGVLSEVTANEIPEDLDRKNEIFMNEEFPLKLNLRQNVENLMDQDIEEENDRYVYMDAESGDVVSDGIEEVRVLKKRK